MKLKNAFILAAALQMSVVLNGNAQERRTFGPHNHHNHSHVVSVDDAEFKVKLPSSDDSFILVDVDLLSTRGETTVQFLRTLSPVGSCTAFDTMNLPEHSTDEEHTKKAALHVLNHMGGATKENIEWVNSIVEHAKTKWREKYSTVQLTSAKSDFEP